MIKSSTPLSPPLERERNLDFLFACVESSNEAVMLTQLDGTIFYVNPAWQRIYGYSKEEAIGENPRILRSGRHSSEFYSKMWTDILDSKIGHWKGELINAAKNGAEVHVLLTISPCMNQQKEVLGYMSISVDISEQKKNERQLQWEDRLATIGTLTSGLAHELGTPLGIIRGRAEFLMQSMQATTAEMASLQSIVDQIDRVSILMHSLQNLSQLSPSEVRMQVPLNKAVQDVHNLIRGKLDSIGADFRAQIPDNAFVLAEPGRLEYVILNLCMNSLQAIQLQKLSLNKKYFVSVNVLEHPKQWELQVHDNGGGISPENMPHLFKPFFTTKEVGQGTGLGLSISHQIVHSWGGSVEVENKPGSDVTFKVILSKA